MSDALKEAIGELDSPRVIDDATGMVTVPADAIATVLSAMPTRVEIDVYDAEDDELTVMSLVLNALQQIDGLAARRVLAWASARYGSGEGEQ